MTKLSDEVLDRMASAYSSAPLGKHAPRDAMQAAWDASPAGEMSDKLEKLAGHFMEYHALRSRGLFNLSDEEARRLLWLEREMRGVAEAALSNLGAPHV